VTTPHRRGIAASPPQARRVLVAALSGVLSYLLFLLPEPYRGGAMEWGAGLVFGALVLAPAGRSWERRAGLLLASALVYRGAVWAAVELATDLGWAEIAACGLAGALAAPLLALASRPLLDGPSRLADHLAALAAGAVGGALVGVAMSGSDERWLHLDLPLLAGLLTWQVGWAASHLRHRPGRG
jgi:hypothetical protein